MLINKLVFETLCSDAGATRTEKARRYKNAGRVKIENVNYLDQNNFEVQASVIGTKIYRTFVEISKGEIQDITCTCPDYMEHYGVCKHTLASVMQLQEEDKNSNKLSEVKKEMDEIFSNSSNEYRNFKQIVNTFYNEEIEELEENGQTQINSNILLEPILFYDKFLNEMKVEFKLGNKRLYKIKDLSEFYTRIRDKEFFKYGAQLEFIHAKEAFDKDCIELLDFLLKYAEIIKYANSNSNSNYRYYGKALSETSIILGNTGIDDFFNIMQGKKIQFQREYTTDTIELLEKDPNIKFTLKEITKNNYNILPNIDIFKVNIIKGKDYKYVLDGNKLYRCSKEFEESNLKLLEIFRKNYITELKLGKKELPELFSVIIPKVKNAIKIDGINQEKMEKYRPKELGVKVFLDFDENDYMVADVKFCYGDDEFNPLEENQNIHYPRNKIQETKALNLFRRTGFMLDIKKSRFILPKEEEIYAFLTQDINYYMQKFEVLVTDNFKTKQIRQPQLGSLGVKVENDLLSLDLKNLDINVKELKEIMNKYSLKKKYHRLKDGSFLNLENNAEIDFLDKLVTGMNITYQELEKGEVKLPVQRTLYLNQSLKGIKGTQITKNDEYKQIVSKLDKELLEEDIEVSNKFDKVLRYYQKTGFKWLKTLDYYKFGGILADDMGLGKTIQMLSIIVDYKDNCKEEKRASLVVSPSSLTLNWQNEVKKFAKDLQALVIRGTLNDRKKQIDEIGNYDLVITSYDLLKRDIELYEEKGYTFRYIIADEAQYLKNSNTQNAKAIKKIKADTRYALTGTPIENSLAELWSIFDYIMPGYLFSYKQFKTMYETPIVKDNDEKAMKKLKMLIEPFVLRRTKKEVLTELPEKTITVLNNEMGEEQKNIYLSYLAQVKQEVADQIEINGFGKSQIQILAALTRLRQICCHPSLFISGYNEGSSKLDQCMEILKEAITCNHKILLFSGYTSMFDIIERELKKENIKYFKLTGATKVDERINLVDEFNENKEVKVFLISLKAGGTGLNLTGADMVIHYDPWWNISTENQATDRAYRIGQKNNVQVYKLITKNSIEEKIYELQEKKAELIDNMLSTKTSFINKLSKQDILNLFEG